MKYLRVLRLISILSFSLLLGINSIYSHPHLFVDAKVKLEAQDGMLKGVMIYWAWDDWWSADVIENCDIDRNRSFDEFEIEGIYSNFFIGLKDMNFFTVITVDEEEFVPENVSRFGASFINDNNIEYGFFIPVNTAIKDNSRIIIRFNDTSIFTAFGGKIDLMESENYAFFSQECRTYDYYGVELHLEISTK